MKKFITCKINESETTNQKALEMATSLAATQAVVPKVVKEEKPPVPAINPPLPLDPPPPDSPPKPRPMLTVKEKKDILKNPDDLDGQFNPEKLLKTIKTEQVTDDPPKPSKPTICRDFIRGNCLRPTPCRFAHVKDLDQLQKVYTFCHNFQNSECKYPNCKYVHATISEEQQFYRTAVLPPHTIAHHKNKATAMVGPPEVKEGPSQPVDMNSFAPRAAPTMTPSMEKPAIACIPAAVMPANGNAAQFINNAPNKLPWNGHDNNCAGVCASRCLESEKQVKCASCVLVENSMEKPAIACIPAAVMPANGNAAQFINNAPNKLPWNGHDNNCAPCLDSEKQVKCASCVLVENRLLHAKNTVETMEDTISATSDKLSLLEKKERRLNAVRMFLMRPMVNQLGDGQPDNRPLNDILRLL